MKTVLDKLQQNEKIFQFIKFVIVAGAHLINYFVQMILLNIFLAIGINQSFAPILVFPIAMIINFFMVRFALKK